MISDSSPLIFLAKINKLYFLKKLFNAIIIPIEVKEEIINIEKIDSNKILEAIKEGWIKIDSSKHNLKLKLGKGESAAINLAKERNDSLIIDDFQGIRAANSLKINTLRTTTVILKALKKKVINKKEAIESINKLLEIGYYMQLKYYSLLITKVMES